MVFTFCDPNCLTIPATVLEFPIFLGKETMVTLQRENGLMFKKVERFLNVAVIFIDKEVKRPFILQENLFQFFQFSMLFGMHSLQIFYLLSHHFNHFTNLAYLMNSSQYLRPSHCSCCTLAKEHYNILQLHNDFLGLAVIFMDQC